VKRAAILLIALALSCSKGEKSAAPVAKKSAPKPAAAAKPSADTGSAMPAYKTTTLDGKPFDLAAEKGGVVFLNVWATWCNPCRAEIPELKKLHDKYRERGFKVVGISIEESSIDDVKAFVKEQKIEYPIAYDADDTIANLLQTTVLPTSVILDKKGTIVWKHVGAVNPNDIGEIESVIEKSL
jgi:thiol-disulfide isomerase/thioredoxin